MQKNNSVENFSLLYLVNFYGTPPLNYFSKYLKESTSCNLYVLKLPSVALSKDGINYEAFLLDPSGNRKTVVIKKAWKLPSFCVYLLQYLFNFYSAIILTREIGTFDIGIGETSFGSFIMFLYRKIGKVGKSVFMNGDVLPIFKGRIKPYYLNSQNKLYQVIDRIFVCIQLLMRRTGIHNDIVWYANIQTRNWDLANGLKADNYFIAPAVTIDKNETLHNLDHNNKNNVAAYIGRLDENAGVGISLQALALAVKKIPDLKFIFVGGNPVSVKKYQEMSQKLGVEKNTEFKGFVENTQEALNICKQAKIGLALYKPDEENVSMYADVAKPKDYLRVGLPILMTSGGPVLSTELENYGAALLTTYDPEEIARSLVEVMNNREKYGQLLLGVEKAAEKYDYRENFKYVFDTIAGQRQNPNIGKSD